MRHSDAVLVDTSEHLHYEVGMLFGAAHLFPQLIPGVPPLGTLGPLTEMLRNAALESFVTHLRNLIAFLYDKPKRREALTAEHFVRDVDAWRKARGRLSPVLAKARSRADREVSHLTTRRYTGTSAQKEWHVIEIIKALMPLLRAFRQHTPDQRLHPRFRKEIDGLVARIYVRQSTEGGS